MTPTAPKVGALSNNCSIFLAGLSIVASSVLNTVEFELSIIKKILQYSLHIGNASINPNAFHSWTAMELENISKDAVENMQPEDLLRETHELKYL